MSTLDVGQIVKEAYDETNDAFNVILTNASTTKVQQDTIPWLIKGIPFQVTLGDLALNNWDYVAVTSGVDSDTITVSGASASVNGVFSVMYTDANKTTLEEIIFV